MYLRGLGSGNTNIELNNSIIIILRNVMFYIVDNRYETNSALIKYNNTVRLFVIRKCY